MLNSAANRTEPSNRNHYISKSEDPSALLQIGSLHNFPSDQVASVLNAVPSPSKSLLPFI